MSGGAAKVDVDTTQRRLGAHHRARVEDLLESVFEPEGLFQAESGGARGMREALSLTCLVSSRWTPTKWRTEGLDVGGAHECHA